MIERLAVGVVFVDPVGDAVGSDVRNIVTQDLEACSFVGDRDRACMLLSVMQTRSGENLHLSAEQEHVEGAAVDK